MFVLSSCVSCLNSGEFDIASPLRVTDSSVRKKGQIPTRVGGGFLPFAEKLVIAAKQVDLTSSLGSLSESRIDLNAPDLTISAAISPAKRCHH